MNPWNYWTKSLESRLISAKSGQNPRGQGEARESEELIFNMSPLTFIKIRLMFLKEWLSELFCNRPKIYFILNWRLNFYNIDNIISLLSAIIQLFICYFQTFWYKTEALRPVKYVLSGNVFLMNIFIQSNSLGGWIDMFIVKYWCLEKVGLLYGPQIAPWSLLSREKEGAVTSPPSPFSSPGFFFLVPQLWTGLLANEYWLIHSPFRPDCKI